MRTRHYSPGTSQIADKLATFGEQMADFARGEQLRDLRKALHLSQEDAAHEIGVSTKSLRAWEKGGKIKWENAQAAGAFYGVDPETLVTRGGEEPVVSFELPTTHLARIEAKLDRLLAAVEVSPAGGDETTVPPLGAGPRPPNGGDHGEPPTASEASG
jgi:transcriptional regulator with XRE-family HTH domain